MNVEMEPHTFNLFEQIPLIDFRKFSGKPIILVANIKARLCVYFNLLQTKPDPMCKTHVFALKAEKETQPVGLWWYEALYHQPTNCELSSEEVYYRWGHMGDRIRDHALRIAIKQDAVPVCGSSSDKHLLWRKRLQRIRPQRNICWRFWRLDLPHYAWVLWF